MLSELEKRLEGILMRYYWSKEHIRNYEAELCTITESIDRAIAKLNENNDMAGTTIAQATKDEIEELMVARVEVAQCLLTVIHQEWDERNFVITLITGLPDPAMRAVFEHRYYKNETFETIALETRMSTTKVKRLHRDGLKFFCQRDYGPT